ncbi:unnamed protein product [Amoebophrya sp. A120]|nr:unnamed protein product [Amoebophrya sp. A120]|eukprot:GSA120T00001103001.1
MSAASVRALRVPQEGAFCTSGASPFQLGELDENQRYDRSCELKTGRFLRRGQAELVSSQVCFRRDLGIATFTMPAPCAHVYDRLPIEVRPDFFKLYQRIKNPVESAQALSGDNYVEQPHDTFSSEVMVAMLLTKRPPGKASTSHSGRARGGSSGSGSGSGGVVQQVANMSNSCSTSCTNASGKTTSSMKPLITLPARQLQPNMKRLSIQLDSQAYYSCCKVDKICPELELANWVEIIKTFSVEHGRFGKSARRQGPHVRRISFDGPDLDKVTTEQRRLLSTADHEEALRRDWTRICNGKLMQVRTEKAAIARKKIFGVSRDEVEQLEAVTVAEMKKNSANDDHRFFSAGASSGFRSTALASQQSTRGGGGLLGAGSGTNTFPPSSSLHDQLAAALSLSPTSKSTSTPKMMNWFSSSSANFSTASPTTAKRFISHQQPAIITPQDPRWMACACLVHPAIEILDCTGVALKKDSLCLISVLRHLHTLILDKNPLLVAEDLPCLAEIEQLEKLEVSYCHNLTTLNTLSKCPMLREVVARCCDRLGWERRAGGSFGGGAYGSSQLGRGGVGARSGAMAKTFGDGFGGRGGHHPGDSTSVSHRPESAASSEEGMIDVVTFNQNVSYAGGKLSIDTDPEKENDVRFADQLSSSLKTGKITTSFNGNKGGKILNAISSKQHDASEAHVVGHPATKTTSGPTPSVRLAESPKKNNPRRWWDQELSKEAQDRALVEKYVRGETLLELADSTSSAGQFGDAVDLHQPSGTTKTLSKGLFSTASDLHIPDSSSNLVQQQHSTASAVSMKQQVVKAVKIQPPLSRSESKLGANAAGTTNNFNFMANNNMTGSTSATAPHQEINEQHEKLLLDSKTVKILNVEDCPELEIVRMNTVVETLDLSYLPKVRQLTANFKCLRQLDLSFCGALKELNYTTVFEAAPLLKIVNAAHCDNLTAVNVQQAPCLEVLHLAHCQKLRTLGENLFPAGLKFVDCYCCFALQETEIAKVYADIGAAFYNFGAGGRAGSARGGRGAGGQHALKEGSKESSMSHATSAGTSNVLNKGAGGSVAGKKTSSSAGGSEEDDHAVDVLGSLDVVLLEEVPSRARKGSLCRLLDAWQESDLQGRNSWHYLLRVTFVPGTFSKRYQRGEELIVAADKLGSTFEFVNFEDLRLGAFPGGHHASIAADTASVCSDQSLLLQSNNPLGINLREHHQPMSPFGIMAAAAVHSGFATASPLGAGATSSFTQNYLVGGNSSPVSSVASSRGASSSRSASPLHDSSYMSGRRGSVFARSRAAPLFVWPGSSSGTSTAAAFTGGTRGSTTASVQQLRTPTPPAGVNTGTTYQTSELTTPQAARAKFWKACQKAAQLAILEEDSNYGGNRNDVHAIARHSKDVVEELQDAYALLEKVKVREIPLVLAGLKYLRDWAPDTEILDPLGSSLRLRARDVAKHLKESTRRRLLLAKEILGLPKVSEFAGRADAAVGDHEELSASSPPGGQMSRTKTRTSTLFISSQELQAKAQQEGQPISPKMNLGCLPVPQFGHNNKPGYKPNFIPVFKGVRCDEKHLFVETCKAVQEALWQSMDPDRIKQALTRACGPKNPRFVLKADKREGCCLSEFVLKKCERYLAHLEHRIDYWKAQLTSKAVMSGNRQSTKSSTGSQVAQVAAAGGNSNNSNGGNNKTTEINKENQNSKNTTTNAAVSKTTSNAPLFYQELISLEELSESRFLLKQTAFRFFEQRDFQANDSPAAVPKRAHVLKELCQFFRKTFLDKLWWKFKIVVCLPLPPNTNSNSAQATWLRDFARNQARFFYVQMVQNDRGETDERFVRLLDYDGEVEQLQTGATDNNNYPKIYIQRIVPEECEWQYEERKRSGGSSGAENGGADVQ